MTVENLSINVKTNAGSAAAQIRGLAYALNAVQDSAKSTTGATRSVASGVSRVSTAAKKANVPLGHFLSSLKRIAFYRFIRSIIKGITEAFQEGLKNAYNFSKGIDGTLSKSLDRLASASLKMKNQLGAAFGNLLQLIMPVILQIISLITQLANAISALLSAFGGGQYLVAKDVEQGWDAATGAAKKYKNTILGFDEINRLNDENGGGGASAVNANDMFELGTVPKNIADFAQSVRSMIDAGAWESVGQYIFTKVSDAIKSVDWSGVGGKGVGLITAVFDFVIGAFNGVDWGAVGKSISDFFSGAISKFDEWVQKVNWSELGQKIYTAIDNFIRNIDWGKLARGMINFFGNALVAAKNLLGGACKSVIEQIKEYFRGYIQDENNDGKWSSPEIRKGIQAGLAWKMDEWFQWLKDNVMTPLADAFFKLVGVDPATCKSLEDVGKQIMQNIWNGMKSFVQPIIDWFGQIWQAVAWNVHGGTTIDASGFSHEAISFGRSFGGGNHKFASGGFPDQGSLFIAGEAGAELVSTSSSGQTQVSNTNQIAASVSVGNVGVVQAINDLIRAVENKDTSPVVTIGDRDVYRANQRGQQKVGRSLVATV